MKDLTNYKGKGAKVKRSFSQRSEIPYNNLTRESDARSAQDQMIKYVRRQRGLYRVDIDKWRKAHRWAIDLIRPRRQKLIEVYKDMVLDNHLSAVMDSRFLKILNTPFHILNENGERDDEATELIKQRWATKLNRLAMESIFYGYSLVFLKVGTDGIDDVDLVPREHVIPERHGVLEDLHTDKIIPYNQLPESDFYIPIGEPTDLGLLLKASPMVIFKKNSIQHWSQLQERFGIPPIVAKTGSRDEKVHNEIEKWLRELSTNAYGLFPQDTEIEISNTQISGAKDIFKPANDLVDEQLSKLILGQTMTTDNGSSKSQSEVHERKESEVTAADYTFLEYEWNDKVIPRLITHGFPLENRFFRFDQTKTLPLQEQWKMVKGMLDSGYQIPNDYIQETFDVPIEGKVDPPPGGGQGGPF